MPLKILSITPGSLLAGKLQTDDIIISINDKTIYDFLDLQFYASEEELSIKFSREGVNRILIIYQDWQKPLGIEPVPHRCRTCANNCIFCFIDQMRPGFRKPLYVKDDDYRLSFVYGNFITLTNLAAIDIDRIIEQRLQPLYISVHTTDSKLHKAMLRYNHEFDIMKTLQRLCAAGIEMHTQIVVVPGWNDGAALQRSLSDLSSSAVDAHSIGIVPVGLTRYRETLPQLKAVDPDLAEDILKIAAEFPRTYCSDELFLLAQRPLPNMKYYDDFPQLENGIGMLRLLLENWHQNKKEFLTDLNKINSDILLITGELAFATITNIAEDISQNYDRKVRVQKIINNFMGKQVTVAGLLSGQDIIEQVQLESNETILLSSALFNSDGLTLDNIWEGQLQKRLDSQLIIVDEEFASWRIL